MSGEKKGIVELMRVIDDSEELKKSGGDTPPDIRPVEFSDDALAEELSQELGDDWLYMVGVERWHYWTGKVWRADDLHSVLRHSRMICRAAANRCTEKRVARQISSAGTIYSVAKLTAKSPRHAIATDAFDRDPDLLNTPAGIIDLRTGDLSPHRREARLSKMTRASPGGKGRRFFRFLEEISNGDKEIEGFLKRFAGYSLTGSIEEHAMLFAYGRSGTGKSTFINLIADALGDYATAASPDTFMEQTGTVHSTDLAALHGARMVISIETQEGRRWDEAKLKAAISGDRMRVRFMRQDSFELIPQFKLWIASNWKPLMRSADDAMRRRLNLIQFSHRVARLDKTLPEVLRKELGAVLAWMIEGELERHRIGLSPPLSVVTATDEYFAVEDVLGRWGEERCSRDPFVKATSRELYRDYRSWAATMGEIALPLRRFVQKLEQRGFQRWRDPATAARGFQGIAPLQRETELPLEQSSRDRRGDFGGLDEATDKWESD